MRDPKRVVIAHLAAALAAAASGVSAMPLSDGGATWMDHPAGLPSTHGHTFPTTRTTVIDGSTERVTYQLVRGEGGYIRGVDQSSGKPWHADIAPDGQIRGEDLDGARWSYDPASHLFTNQATGRTCLQSTLLHVCAR